MAESHFLKLIFGIVIYIFVHAGFATLLLPKKHFSYAER